jgi:PEGA domain
MRSRFQASCARALGVVTLCLLGSPALGAPPPKKLPAPAAPVAPPAPPTLSQTLTGMAKAEFEAAKILYQDNDFANAIVKFQHAYDLASDPRLLWNIAACEKNLRHYVRALAAIGRYQKEGGASLTDEDRNDAAELDKVLRTLISTLTVLVSEPGADVFVDEEKIGTSPLAATTLVDVGKRSLRVHKPGFKDFAESREAQGGTAFTVVAKLEKEIHRGQALVQAGPKDLISIDGKAVAQGRWEGPLASGGHTLRVTAPGMVAYQSELVVQDDRKREIGVTLVPLPKPAETSTWVWITSGAVVAVGAIIGGAVLFKPSEIPPAQGTLGTYPASFSFGGRR